ncbi:MAG: ATP-binding protein [Phycisphaerales bacterium]|nr:ATP-binding protein [Phycisphaerales bacterium]
MTDGRPHITVEMLSNPVYLSGARQLVSSVAQRLGFDEMACSQIALAVDEALCNVIRHGYDRAVDRPIWLSLWPVEEGKGGLRIVIEDEAKQVDLDAIKGRKLEDVRPGGLGVHIIREVMDEVKYERREGAGMRLTLVKRVPMTAGPKVTPKCERGCDG